MTNTICCRPPENDIGSFEAQEAAECCSPGFDEELSWLRRFGAKVLVPLGNTATLRLGVVGKITDNRGSVFQRHGLPVVPSYHPAAMLHRKEGISKKRDIGTQMMTPVFYADLRKARRIALEGWAPPKEDFNVAPTLEDLRGFVGRMVTGLHLVSLDIETTGLNPATSNLVVVGLADSTDRALVVPFLTQGGRQYWKHEELGEVRTLLNWLFTTCPLLVQYAFFDVPFLRGKGFTLPWEAIHHDTLILHHTISPELPHNLGFMVSVYGTTPFWKAAFRDRTAKILDMDNYELRTYNARDAVTLHQILPPMLAELADRGLQEVYQEEALPLLKPVGKMMERGIRLDPAALGRFRRGLEEERSSLETQLRLQAHLPAEFNFDSIPDLVYFLYGVEPAKFSHLVELGEYEEETKTGKRVLKTDTKKYKALLALKSLKEEVQPLYRFSYRGGTTDTGAFSTDETALLGLRIHLQGLLEERKIGGQAALEIKSLLEWLSLFGKYRGVAKLLSTYTSYPVAGDGRIHTKFNNHGTATGRLSSEAPNLQNIPSVKERPEARRCFVASEGMELLSVDYVNLEVYILAAATGDPKITRILEEGGNIHDDNTRVFFGITPEHPQWAIARGAAKIIQFGRIQYGGGDAFVHREAVLACPELNLTFAHFQRAVRNWMEAHPWYVTWSRKVVSEALSTHRVATLLGRVRELFTTDFNDLRKEALNTPIQGTASGIINRAMIRIDKRLEEEFPGQAHLLLQVHDELIFEVLPTERRRLQEMVTEEMSRPVKLTNGKTISFPVDAKVGPTWGDLRKVE